MLSNKVLAESQRHVGVLHRASGERADEDSRSSIATSISDSMIIPKAFLNHFVRSMSNPARLRVSQQRIL